MRPLKITTLLFIELSLLLAGTGCSTTTQATAKKEAAARWKGVRVAMALQIAEKQYKTGQITKCRETLQEAMKTQNDDPRVFILMARVLFELQDLSAAEEHLQTARRLNPSLAETDYWQGVIAQSASQPEQAHQAYFAAYAKEPNSLVYLCAMLESKLALGRAEETAKLSSDRFIDFPRSVPLRLIAAHSYMVLKKYDKAEEFYQQALDVDSASIEAQEGLAHVLYLEKKYSRAIPILQKLTTRRTPDRTDLRFMLGNCHLAMRSYSPAIRTYEDSLAKDPLQPNVRFNLAKARLLNDQAGLADQELRMVLQQQPENPQAWELLGHVYLQERKYDQAQSAYHQAIQKGTNRTKLASYLEICSGGKP